VTIPATEVTLPDPTRRVHRLLIDTMVATGDVPGESDLAVLLGISVDAIREHLRTLVRADYVGLDAAGRVACLYPFSATRTRHGADIGGERRFAMCPLDALGTAAMVGRRVDIASDCPVCGCPSG
jgi:Alkylmercury lyase